MKELTEQDYQSAAALLECEPEALMAVAEIESNGSGFLPNNLPKILFEGHLFHKFTEGKYDTIEPTISYPGWTKKYYLGGEKEWERYHIARALDDLAAKKATSWGKFQILGANHRDAGYESVNDFVYDMQLDETYHLKAFLNVIINWGLAGALRKCQWELFARKYNGPAYKKNQYDEKISDAYIRFKAKNRKKPT